MARSITDPRLQANALTAVAQALAREGQAERAEAVARSFTQPDDQANALRELAEALAWAGETGQAEAVARSMGRWQAHLDRSGPGAS